MKYAEQLKHPKWQRRRLEIMSRAGFACEQCGDTESTLHVHHKAYRDGAMAWEYLDEELVCLCEDCHERQHEPYNAGIFETLLAGVPGERERRELIAATFKLWSELLGGALQRGDAQVAEMIERDWKVFRASPGYEKEMRRREAIIARIRGVDH